MSNPNAPGDRIVPRFDPEQSLPAILARFLQEQPDKIALIEDDQSRTWAESIRRIYRMANGLLDLGIVPGDRVAMLSRNSMDYSEMFAATLMAGACAVPLQSMITNESLDMMLRDSNARVLVISSEFSSMAELFLADSEQLLDGGLIGFDFSDERHVALNAWLTGQSDTAPSVQLQASNEFNIIYSSGTTGVPKGIVHSHATRQGLATGIGALGVGGDSITLIATPLYSNTTITTWWPTLCGGGTLIIMRKFDAAGALALIQQHRVTHVMLVPVQYDRIMRLDNYADFDLSSLQCKFCTSAPLRAALKDSIISHFPGELMEFYGLTEGGVGTLFVGSIAKNMGKLGSVGSPLPGSTLKIIDEQGNELALGETGEIVGRSGNMSEGYHNRDDATQEMHWYDSDGTLFYRSGDVGYLDADGWLFLSDRRKDMIISGGFNIYATDIELVVLEHPQVHEVAVVALPSREWGETPLALVVREPKAVVDEQALREWANARLGKAQRISVVEFTDELPKSSIGKVLKRELREAYAYLGNINQ